MFGKNTLGLFKKRKHFCYSRLEVESRFYESVFMNHLHFDRISKHATRKQPLHCSFILREDTSLKVTDEQYNNGQQNILLFPQ